MSAFRKNKKMNYANSLARLALNISAIQDIWSGLYPVSLEIYSYENSGYRIAYPMFAYASSWKIEKRTSVRN